MKWSILLVLLSAVFTKFADANCNCDNTTVNPVCGSDNTTYPNECFLDCASQYISGLNVQYRSNCAIITGDICTCKRHDSKVCGSNNVTYSNECELFCNQRKHIDLTLQTNHSCTNDLCKCGNTISPVCGTDNKTYPNSCLLDCEGAKNFIDLKVAYNSYCLKIDEGSKECVCPKHSSPVCGSNSVTYANECEFQCQLRTFPDLFIVKEEACSWDACSCEDGKIDPVCATNGQSFLSFCHFNCDQHTSNANLELKYRSICAQFDNTTERCMCEYDYNPVCGSDSITYINECELFCQQKINPDLFIQQRSPCKSDKCNHEMRNLKIVCGSDGVTYPTEEYLMCEKYSTKPDLVKVHNGFCPQISNNICICNKYDKSGPACGSNSITYENECQLYCAKRKDPTITISESGPCPSANDYCFCDNDNLKPVCGSSGQSYFTQCHLNCESIREEPGLRLEYSSYCMLKNDTNGHCECELDVNPVCGTNSVTYRNECELNCQKIWDKHLDKFSDGPCINDQCNCGTELKMVCGTDGESYFNICYLNCEVQTDNKPGLKKLRDGMC